MNLKSLKQITASILGNTLPLGYFFKIANNRYILAYHRIVPFTLTQRFNMQESMWITPETFNNDVVWMKRHGDIVDLNTILNFEIPNNKPLFSITFDDGWIDNYQYAFPILKQNGIPATIFLVTDAMETGNIFWVEDILYKIAMLSSTSPRGILNNVLKKHYALAGGSPSDNASTNHLAEGLAELIKPLTKEKREVFLHDLYNELNINPKPLNDQIMSWSNVVEMSEAGIEFGSHTHTHEILQYADNDIILEELETSKNMITEKTGKPVRYFCYPNARYREDNADLLSQTGYEYAFRIHNLRVTKNQHRYFVPRFLLNERTCRNKNYLLCKLLGLPKF